MSDMEQLAQMRSYGVALRDYLNELDLPPDARATAATLARLAGGLVDEADGPLRIGVVGEFSSGKSLLLGVLLNNPCLLPTSAHPTTGNVTELRFTRGPDAGEGTLATRIDRARIRYFTGEDLTSLDQRLMNELDAAAKRLGIAGPGEPAGIARPDTDRLVAWCEKVWEAGDPASRKLIRELLLTRAAASKGSDLLGTTRTVDLRNLPEVLQIPRLDRPDVFPRVPVTGWVSPASDGGHPDWAFPLVDRVVLDVYVPPESWNLADLPASSEFSLLDFPGVGGSLTHVRDLFLTQRGLRDVHTVLVMVDSEKPGGATADSFYGFLRELTATESGQNDVTKNPAEPLANRLLYCASRFDMLKPPGEAELAASVGTAGLTEQALLSESGPLWALLQSGHRPGASSMSAILSSVTAIALTKMSPVPAGLDLDHHAGNAVSNARRWREIADTLTAGGTGRDLANALHEYAEDGGVKRLRVLLERHVAEHGLHQRIARLRDQVAEVERSKQELLDLLRSSPAFRRPAADDPAVAAGRLLGDLNRYRNRYESLLLPRLQDPSMIEVRPGWSLRDDVAQRAAELVIEWEQWSDILACVRDAVVVPPEDRGSDENDYEELGLPSLEFPEQYMPHSTEDFIQIFTNTAVSLREYSRARAFEGLQQWLKLRARDGQELRRRADRMLTPEARQRLKDSRLGHVAIGIDELLGPDLLYEAVVRAITKRRQANEGFNAGDHPLQQRPSIPDGFPLRREQVTPWAADAIGDEASRHVIRVLRMRSAFIASVTEIALSDLDELQFQIFKQLSNFLTGRVKLPESTQQETFVAAITGEKRSDRRMPTDQFAALDAIHPPAGYEGTGYLR